MKTLIKSPSLRKCIRYWAEYNDVEKVEVFTVNYDRGGVFITDAVLLIKDIRSGVCMYVWRTDEVYLKNEKTYSIKDLIGGEQ